MSGPSFSYTLSPANPPSTDPLVVSADQSANLVLKALRDYKYDFAAEDIVTPRVIVTGADAILQRLVIRWRFFLGEWFLDQRLGVPWFQRILIKGADLRDVRQLLIDVALQVPGVKTVEDFVVVFDRSKRRISITGFTIVLSDGSFARLEVPFIL